MKIAINGFGRIGRQFFRLAFGEKDFDIIAINDLTDIPTLSYLLTYDSVYGRYAKKVEAGGNALLIDGNAVLVFAKKDPAQLPWKDLDIDVVVESTGFFTSGEKAQVHLDAGARRVVISAPGEGDVDTILVGVNDDRFSKSKKITCNASCTTNSVSPVMQMLVEHYGVEKASMTTIHGYTATQKLVDAPDPKDMRRGRAAAANIVPSTTGAAKAVIDSIPELEGKFDAVAMRVPVITGSISVMNVFVKKDVTREEVNEMFKKEAMSTRWSKSVKTTNDQIVSTDIIGEPYGAIIDLSLTKVTGKNLVQAFSWYDNEAGYTATLVEHIRRVGQNL